MDEVTDDSRTPYLRIVDDLRRSIANGEIPPGEALPSNAQLKRRYNVASQTAQNAINALKSEGLVYGVAGKGVFVRSDVDISSISLPVTADSKTMREVLTRLEALERKVARLEAEGKGS